MEDNDEIISIFDGDRIILLFGTKGYFNEKVDREIDNSWSIDKENKIKLGFTNMTTNYKKEILSDL